MKILFLGDLVGRSGRDVAVDNLPRLRRELALDFVVVNGENAAHGFGLTDKICVELFEAGTDVITSGNHIRSEGHTSELQSLMRISYAVFCLKKKTTAKTPTQKHNQTTQ